MKMELPPCQGKDVSNSNVDSEKEKDAGFGGIQEKGEGEHHALIHDAFRPRAKVCVVPSWFRPVRNWTLVFTILWAMLVLLSSDALAGVVAIQVIATFLFWFCFVDLIKFLIQNLKTKCGDTNGDPSPSTTPIKSWWYVLIVSTFLLWKPGLYVATFYFFKTNPTMEKILHELQNEGSTTIDDWNRRPMQALFFGNVYARKLGQALNIHFDRYERNETAAFGYVQELNLIGNLFDDNGVGSVVDALSHPFSYTDSLLLGRNEGIGDKTATRLAKLINSSNDEAKFQDHPEVTTRQLTWLEFGGTAVTKTGLSELYHSMKSRSFSYLGLEYTRRNHIFLSPFFFKNFGISRSFKDLHNAKYLQHISLTGNKLDDDDIAALAEEVLQTNITTLTLFKNKIGPAGVDHLVPLTTVLTELALSMNKKIGDDGAEILAEALKLPEASLETLFLTNCNIGQKGAEALLSIFPANTRLKYLSLVSGNEDNGISEDTLKALEKSVAANWN